MVRGMAEKRAKARDKEKEMDLEGVFPLFLLFSFLRTSVGSDTGVQSSVTMALLALLPMMLVSAKESSRKTNEMRKKSEVSVR